MAVMLLGFVDQQISDTSSVSWDANKIGGSPVSNILPFHDISCTMHKIHGIIVVLNVSL